MTRGRLLPHNPLDPQLDKEPLLLIFDGLDELAMQGRIGQEAAADFIAQLQRALGTINLQKLHLKALVCGRELVVEQNRRAFERAQILHVLPYTIDPKWDERSYREIKAKLGTDQRDAWWRAYGEAKGEPLEGMPAELRRPDLDEITAQPLLNYLLALSRKRGRLDLASATNLNDVYDDLLAAVWKRRWGERQLADVPSLGKPDFERVFEGVALAAWHGGDVRAVSAGVVRTICEQSRLLDKLAAFERGAEKGAVSLLAAFYVRQAGFTAEGERTFEFSHKSFGEFLVARRLVRALQRLAKELAAREDDLETGWDERQALVHWAELAGPTQMDLDLFAFVCREVARRDYGVAADWQRCLVRLLGFACGHDWPMERLTDRNRTFAEQRRQARNAEEALLAALSACAGRTGQPSQVRWPTPPSLGDLLCRLQGQRWGPEKLTLACLNYLDLHEQALHFADLFGANLKGANLEGANLIGAMLEGANLADANLEGANLERANLERANLQGANLKGANLERTYLQGAILIAMLEGANLKGANLKGAILKGAMLERANLQGANLIGANLKGANLKGANLKGANLIGANLEGANLEGANLERAMLQGANLKGANLIGANLPV